MTTAPATSEIRAGYDRWAKVYDHDRNPLPALEEPVMQSVIGRPADLVLDLGCGTGRHALWLADRGVDVIACDFSPRMLAEARAKIGARCIRLVEADLSGPLPFEDATFELVVSGLVLEHLERPKALFREIARVMASEGRAVLSTMHPAMFLRGSKARFTDPSTSQIVEPGSFAHGTGDFVMAALSAGLQLFHLSDHAPTEAFVERFPRAGKYVGYPMLQVFGFAGSRA